MIGKQKPLGDFLDELPLQAHYRLTGAFLLWAYGLVCLYCHYAC